MEKEDHVASILAATFRGNNDEIENAAKELDHLIKEPDFPDVLFSIIINRNYDIAIRKSASIQILRIIKLNLIPDLNIFYQKFAIIIESSDRELFPLFEKCIYFLICFSYQHLPDLPTMIFSLLSQNHYVPSLFYANSFLRIIANSNRKSIEMFKSFTSNYLFLLHDFFLSIFTCSEGNFENESKKELISLIFQFLAISVSYLQPEIFDDYSQIQFWFPSSMESFNAVEYDEYHYLNFLSNWPKRKFQGNTDPNFLSLIAELTTWLYAKLSKYKEIKVNEGFDFRLISMSLKILYKLINFNLLELNADFFREILISFILPSFNIDNLIDYNHPITDDCWDNLHDASLYLFTEIIEKNQQFLGIFYSLFESPEFIQSDYFISALDLSSLCEKLFYKIDSSYFLSFIYNLEAHFEISNDNIKIVILKFFSNLNRIKIELRSEFLFNSIKFSFTNIFNENSLVRYFAALSLSSLISFKKSDSDFKSQFFQSIEDKINDIFNIFFELEREYQTQMITESLMKIIFFFDKNIQPLLFQISNEVINLFFCFASNPENSEPSILLSSILCKLIELAEGDTQFTTFVLQSLLNMIQSTNICYDIAFDKLFEIFTSLIYYSTEFLEDFGSIIPLLNAYLNDTKSTSHLFADFSSVVEMLIWKKSILNESNAQEVDSNLIEFLNQFLQSCQYLDEWALAASLSIKIKSFSNLFEISYILPKLLDFLQSNPANASNSRVYAIVEHSFTYYCSEIFTNFPEAVNFFFNIYINFAEYPSFIDSFLKCFDSLPDDWKPIAYQKACSLADRSKEIDNEEEEEWHNEEEEENILSPQWFDENEILRTFESFKSNCKS